MLVGVPVGPARGDDDSLYKFDLVLHSVVVKTSGTEMGAVGVDGVVVSFGTVRRAVPEDLVMGTVLVAVLGVMITV